MTEVILIAGIAENFAIGKSGKLLWNISDDLKRFKKVTMGHVIVFGQKTFETCMGNKPLSGRKNIVLTHDKNATFPDGVIALHSVNDVLDHCKDEDSIYICGGGQVYKAFMPYATELDITHIHKNAPDADTFFPKWDENEWEEISRDDKEGFSWVRYKRKKK